MNNFKEDIINQLFKLLLPLRNAYKEEIDNITNDLIMNNFESLDSFVKKHYQNTSYNNAIIDLTKNLVNNHTLPDSYLKLLEDNTSYFIFDDNHFANLIIKANPISEVINSKIPFMAFAKPINVRLTTLAKIKTKLSKITNIVEDKEINDDKVIENDNDNNVKEVKPAFSFDVIDFNQNENNNEEENIVNEDNNEYEEIRPINLDNNENEELKPINLDTNNLTSPSLDFPTLTIDEKPTFNANLDNELYKIPDEIKPSIDTNIVENIPITDNFETKIDIPFEKEESPTLENEEIKKQPIVEIEPEVSNKENEEKEENTDINSEDEFLSLDNPYIEKLRKSILESQLNYLENANEFIKELEAKDAEGIYNDLLVLNDIRYIYHCISKLSLESLDKLLNYTEENQKENNHNSINIFIEEAIKKARHAKNDNLNSEEASTNPV